MKPLPHASRARAEERKIREYLLNLAHADGGPKARFFRNRGFDQADWEGFADALRHHARHNAVHDEEATEYGTIYRLDCNIPTPDRQNPCIRTVWEIRENDERPRLITVHPLG